jgi:hypothetical protein
MTEPSSSFWVKLKPYIRYLESGTSARNIRKGLTERDEMAFHFVRSCDVEMITHFPSGKFLTYSDNN